MQPSAYGDAREFSSKVSQCCAYFSTHRFLAVDTAIVRAKGEELLTSKANTVRPGLIGVVERGDDGLLFIGRQLY